MNAESVAIDDHGHVYVRAQFWCEQGLGGDQVANWLTAYAALASSPPRRPGVPAAPAEAGMRDAASLRKPEPILPAPGTTGTVTHLPVLHSHPLKI